MEPVAMNQPANNFYAAVFFRSNLRPQNEDQRDK